ncbi:MAG: M6 family metalloprotease domain-containing protein [Paludibacteraceae bacterium]|nr:M6 family metalloprotease domain-containing protein [Paludibacteraceae bacterium]
MNHRLLSFLCVAAMLCVNIGMQAQTYLPDEDTPIEQRYYPSMPNPFGKALPSQVQRKRSEAGATLPPKGLLLLVQFSDTAFFTPNPHTAFDSLANSIDYTYNGAFGSAREYFRAQSNGQYVPDFTVVGPITLPHTMDYYGKNDSYGYDQYLADFVIDACLAAKDSVDWTQFDSDNDGLVDLVFLLFAGYGEADSHIANTIWPCKWEVAGALSDGYTNQTTYYYTSPTDYNLPTFSGKMVNKFACSNEWTYRTNSRNGIGTFVHEFSHVLGLPDYYVPAGDESHTPGSWSLMGYGNYVNNGNTPPNYSAYDKYFLGWVTPTFLDKNQQVTLPADGNTYYMLTRSGIAPANGAFTQDTVYYLENRQYTGWDAYLPGHGLLIWQVVYDSAAWTNGLPNADAVRYTIITANGENPLIKSTIGAQREGTPFPGSEGVTTLALSPKAILQDITEQADGTITFSFTKIDEPTGIGKTMTIHPQGCYNVLGQPIDATTYQGIVIQDGKVQLLIR